MSDFREHHASSPKALTANKSTTSIQFGGKPGSLSELERLRLASQYAIGKKLDFTNAEYWATCRKALVEGHTFSYSKSFEPIRWQQLDYEKCLDVLNAADMCNALQRSFAGITDSAAISGDAVPHFVCFVDLYKQEKANRFRAPSDPPPNLLTPSKSARRVFKEVFDPSTGGHGRVFTQSQND
jgi:hypothetical protein